MKIIKTSCLSGLLLAAVITTAHAAEPLTGCAAKRQEVETQIEHARAHGNKAQEKKLNIALKQIVDHCTDEGLRKEREADIKKKENNVAERKAELEKAQASGKTKKIAKQQKKLQEAETELQEAKNKLTQ
ncbi:MAG: DUF1090 domain-containing protein [Burkholderiaceae bacterium]|uniref:DUF1090 domain-containing protein n=1 Tax=Herminiimonas sp. Marseille-P9896 TaxID=2742211 RepID=UPI00158E8D81|nr:MULTISPECIES: DUF1090 domain-containing protein [Oxalobacteraceae]MBX9800353.1 DUF1090 domain-containing protein [Burkholderiaceae bacterium]